MKCVKVFYLVVVAAMLLMLTSCGGGQIKKSDFGQVKDKDVNLYTLENDKGAVMKVTNYGGIITSLTMPDRNGNFDDIVLGYDNLQSYLDENPYFGAIIGRYGNRIGEGRFALDGETYQLLTNDGENHLHGGTKGFDKRVWKAVAFESELGPAVSFRRISKDNEQGYPGNLDVTVIYTLSNNNELIIDYRAKTDEKTICNLTHHSYFNLEGHDAGSILDHELMINADYFTPVNSGLIPTGEVRAVEDTPFDFTQPVAIGKRIDNPNQQLKRGRGYSHNWALKRHDNEQIILAAAVYEPDSGRSMEVWTQEPGVQFYSGNFLDGSITGKDGAVYEHRSGFCLETQHFPDSPNHDNFPSVVLNPDEVYKTRTIYKFSAN
jgi:aldose 1-epimerase